MDPINVQVILSKEVKSQESSVETNIHPNRQVLGSQLPGYRVTWASSHCFRGWLSHGDFQGCFLFL